MEEKIKKFFQEHIEGKDFNELDPNLWEYYSDWHKEVYGFRPHAIVCGEYVNPHLKGGLV